LQFVLNDSKEGHDFAHAILRIRLNPFITIL